MDCLDFTTVHTEWVALLNQIPKNIQKDVDEAYSISQINFICL